MEMKAFILGRQLTLIRHVLSSMTTHNMAVLSIPTKAIQKIHSTMYSFFWRENNRKSKMKWVAWKKICKPVEEGGPGVRDLGEVMKALDVNFIWRFHSEDNLWLNFF